MPHGERVRPSRHEQDNKIILLACATSTVVYASGASVQPLSEVVAGSFQNEPKAASEYVLALRGLIALAFQKKRQQVHSGGWQFYANNLLIRFINPQPACDALAALISRHRSVGGLCLAVRERRFARLGSDKIRTKRLGKGLHRRIVAVDAARPRWPQVRCASSGRPKRGRGAPAAVSVLWRSSAGRRQADGSRSDVVMSGAVNSGRQIGHCNIDANDPEQSWRLEGLTERPWYLG